MSASSSDVPTSTRTATEEALTLTLRHTRRFLAVRLRLSAREENSVADRRLDEFRHSSALGPNSDQVASCLTFARWENAAAEQMSALTWRAQTAQH